MIKEEFKPCPFCGGTETVENSASRNERIRFETCKTCEADGPITNVGAAGRFNWNTRAESAELEQLRQWPQGFDFESTRIGLGRDFNEIVRKFQEIEERGYGGFPFHDLREDIEAALSRMRENLVLVMNIITPGGGVAEIERVRAKVGKLEEVGEDR